MARSPKFLTVFSPSPGCCHFQALTRATTVVHEWTEPTERTPGLAAMPLHVLIRVSYGLSLESESVASDGAGVEFGSIFDKLDSPRVDRDGRKMRSA